MQSAKEPHGLWERIEAFEIDEGQPAFSFPARLARENGWTAPFARRVVMEYKRFVYLAITAEHPVTPSDQVDQAWHLHLTYTRSYWTRMCGETLARALHHNPTRGGDDEDDKFNDWYARTKQTYEDVFGHTPPEDIWPRASVRFGDDLHYRRVNTLHNLVIPRRALGRTCRAGAVVAGAAILVVGCTPLVLRATSNLGQTSDAIVMLIVVGIVLMVIALVWLSRRGGGSGGDGSGGGCGIISGGDAGGHSGGGDHGSGCGSGCGGHGGDGGGSGCGGGGGDGGGCGGGGCGGH